jgi:hypothetical protein
MTDAYLHSNGFYCFNFNHVQVERFKGFIERYVPKDFQNTLTILPVSN